MIRLQQLRLDALLTVDQLAEKCELSAKTIYRLEEGRGARIDTLRKLSTFFEVPASDLLRGVPEFSSSSSSAPTPERRAA